MEAARPTQREPEAGVTLVEILVVLSIIAITTGAAMLRLGFGKSQDDFAAAVQTMALSVTAASDAAMQAGRDGRLELGPLGYRLVSADTTAESSWQTLPGLSFQPVFGRDAALPLMADGASPPFDLRLAGAERTLFLHFDGLTARVEATP
jgi:prepilin-type N-terminal cleavage/methylation domain-containing protein